MNFRVWSSGLFRNGKQLNKRYLSDIVSLRNGKHIIVSKVITIDYINKEGERKIKSSRNYTAFDGYPDLFDFLLYDTYPEEREFHETTPENVKQKPRFDIDIDHKQFKKFLLDYHLPSISFSEFGDRLKDVVIDSCIRVGKSLGVEFDLQYDFMIFTCHRASKRSYHIVLNRFYMLNALQMREFYMACLRACTNGIESLAFNLFVDKAIYNKNANLRILWCVKMENDKPRVKEYSPVFTFLKVSYSHIIYTESYDIIQESEDKLLTKLNILANSLITFTDNADQLPLLPITIKERIRSDEDLPDNVYEECVGKIAKWDTENVFTIRENEESTINLERNYPSHCGICDRIHYTHPSFCYIDNGYLYWHCGRAEGKSGIFLSTLTTVRNNTSDRLHEMFNEGIITEEPKAPTAQSSSNVDRSIVISVKGKVIHSFESNQVFHVKREQKIEQTMLNVEKRIVSILGLEPNDVEDNNEDVKRVDKDVCVENVNTKESNLINSTQVNTKESNLLNSTQVNTKESNLINSTQVNIKESNLINSTQVNTKESNLINSKQVDKHINSRHVNVKRKVIPILQPEETKSFTVKLTPRVSKTQFVQPEIKNKTTTKISMLRGLK